MENGGPISQFPADDLRASQRFITSHNDKGQGFFVKTDYGDHHRVMVRGKGVANIIYSTNANPVPLADEVDITYARENEVFLSLPDWEDEIQVLKTLLKLRMRATAKLLGKLQTIIDVGGWREHRELLGRVSALHQAVVGSINLLGVKK
ncbi:hypothetical protein BDW62DRAFT_206015 [Aspergillus aurantiobrunneus]